MRKLAFLGVMRSSSSEKELRRRGERKPSSAEEGESGGFGGRRGEVLAFGVVGWEERARGEEWVVEEERRFWEEVVGWRIPMLGRRRGKGREGGEG